MKMKERIYELQKFLLRSQGSGLTLFLIVRLRERERDFFLEQSKNAVHVMF